MHLLNSVALGTSALRGASTVGFLPWRRGWPARPHWKPKSFAHLKTMFVQRRRLFASRVRFALCSIEDATVQDIENALRAEFGVRVSMMVV